MSTNMYLKFENPEMEGEASDNEHEGEIEVLSWSHSFHQPTSSSRVSAGGGIHDGVRIRDVSEDRWIASVGVIIGSIRAVEVGDIVRVIVVEVVDDRGPAATVRPRDQYVHAR